MPICGYSKKIFTPGEEEIFIHEFFPDEEEKSSIEVGQVSDEERTCLRQYAKEFKELKLSQIIPDENSKIIPDKYKTRQLKKLLKMKVERLRRLPLPKKKGESYDQMFDIGSDEFLNNLLIKEIIETNGLGYINRAIQLIEEKEEEKTKGGTRRRRNKNTRRRRRRSTYRK
jgi:hypothetical protein